MTVILYFLLSNRTIEEKIIQNLTSLDLLIFKQAKPAHKFLESSYGVHARISHNN